MHKILVKQPMMRRVLLGLLPCVGGAVYYFGWRSLFLIVWAAAAGFFTEYIFTRQRKEPVSEAVFVTTTIFTLIMPPTVPLHALTLGVVFAVMFAKEIFGGFGRNIFNPAMAGRCFVYICFPVALTGTWSPAAQGLWGALDRWTTAAGAQAITGATPMTDLKAGRLIVSSDPQASSQVPFSIQEGKTVHLKSSIFFQALLSGRLSGTMGVTSALLILMGGLYVFFTRTANWSIIISLIASYAVLNQLLYWAGVPPVPGAWPAVFGGGFLFAAFFMATDPVSAPRTQTAKILYGILIATCTVVIRNFSIFNGGLMFSLLIGNMFAPILDYLVRMRQAGKKAQEVKP